MAGSIDIRLNRYTKTYNENDIIQGTVIISSPSSFKHNGISITVDGSVQLHLSGKSVGVFEAFYNSTKPVTLINQTIELAKPGQISNVKTEIPFQVQLKGKPNKPLYETYHGVFVNIQYFLRVDVKRTFLSKDMSKQMEFNVQYSPEHELAADKAVTKPAAFEITSESIQTIQNKVDVPKFKLSGQLDNLCCILTEQLSGELTVEESELPIKSIEIQLLRIETCGCAEGFSRDSTEIQNIQIGDGNVAHHADIPIRMIFPRTFTCPTLTTTNFKIEFEISIVLVFEDDRMISENFPLRLTRY
ncbi:unnamed protein product [Adineta steineri]|uniref:Vacuolar protein sorting-associated protein 26C n=1 Tax=Adineta steineri TaxID=433720 RepID=A0A814LBL7_9BILA|nr:unnamed protein product [Adineta steineri]CAF3953549.1 unnamed protein product [Adineta steineri]